MPDVLDILKKEEQLGIQTIVKLIDYTRDIANTKRNGENKH